MAWRWRGKQKACLPIQEQWLEGQRNNESARDESTALIKALRHFDDLRRPGPPKDKTSLRPQQGDRLSRSSGRPGGRARSCRCVGAARKSFAVAAFHGGIG